MRSTCKPRVQSALPTSVAAIYKLNGIFFFGLINSYIDSTYYIMKQGEMRVLITFYFNLSISKAFYHFNLNHFK